MSEIEKARAALMLEIGAWGINLNASEDVDACVVALIAAAKREAVREAVAICTRYAEAADAKGGQVIGDLVRAIIQDLNALAKEGENA